MGTNRSIPFEREENIPGIAFTRFSHKLRLQNFEFNFYEERLYATYTNETL